jgi:hypothetical protein
LSAVPPPFAINSCSPHLIEGGIALERPEAKADRLMAGAFGIAAEEEQDTIGGLKILRWVDRSPRDPP